MAFTRFALAVLALCIPLTAVAQDRSAHADADADAAAIFDRVMSPYCPGRTLATCGSSAAEDLRDEVREQLASGRSTEDVEAALYRRFGESIRGVPRTSGIGLIAWVLPLICLAGSGAWLITWLRRQLRRDHGDQEPETIAGSPEMIERLDDELASL